MTADRAVHAAPESGELDVIDPLLELDGRQLGDLLIDSGWLARDRVRGRGDGEQRCVLPGWADAEDLSQVGWGVIFPSGRAGELRRRLDPLLRHRQRQAHRRYQEYEVGRDEPARRFLARHEVTPGAMVDPDRLPYYLLLVGDPREISFDFQYHLNIHRAVGRLAFDQLDDYESYAEGVVQAERNGTGRRRRMTYFSVDNGDLATERLTRYFVQPLGVRLPKRAATWPIEIHSGQQATKAALGQLLEDAPSLLVTASHGLRMRPGSRRQTERQGALICQDWPGKGKAREEFCFHAGDLPADARLDGLIAVLAACYGAGTPLEDNFPHYSPAAEVTEKTEPEGLAEKPFVARLPQALLRQGAAAVVGHVDRLWTSSFCWQTGGTTVEAAAHLEETLANLLAGQRIGDALRPLAERSSRLAEELAEPLKWLLDERPVDKVHLASLWTGHNDARNMILLGDPAVKISGQEHSDRDRGESAVAQLPPSSESGKSTTPEPSASGPADEHGAADPAAERSLRLIVRARATPEGSKLVFQIEVLPPIEGVGSLESFESKVLKREPIQYFKDLFRDVESMAGPEAEEILASFGAGLYEELIPERLAARLWAIRDQVETFHVNSDESWIPWELMKLSSPDGTSVDRLFLAERFVLTRWLPVERYSPEQEISVRKLAAVVPRDSGLAWSRNEREMLQALEGPRREVKEIRPARFTQVLDALGAGNYDAWHFSGHGSAWRGRSNQWSIELEGDDVLKADHLNYRGRGLGAARPLVFVNTCSSAPGEVQLTCVGGLVAGFLRKGAGAYLGTHWAVPDRQAAFFAEQFYQSYFQGQATLGEAVRRARLAVRNQFPGDPTWLAYTVFAHPRARCGESLSTQAPEAVSRGIEFAAPKPQPDLAKSQPAATLQPDQVPTGPAEPRLSHLESTAEKTPTNRRGTITQHRTLILASVIIAFVTLLIAVLSNRGIGRLEGQERQLLVRLADHTGAGLRSGEVILFIEGGPYRATTDSNGAALLQVRLPAEDATGQLVAQAPGYEIAERTIRPPREPVVDLRLSARRSEAADVLIRVVDAASGEPVSQAEVLLLLGAEPHTQATDSHGLVRFKVDFHEGKAAAQISVTTPPYAIEHQRMTLRPDAVHDIVLDSRSMTLSPVSSE